MLPTTRAELDALIQQFKNLQSTFENVIDSGNSEDLFAGMLVLMSFLKDAGGPENTVDDKKYVYLQKWLLTSLNKPMTSFLCDCTCAAEEEIKNIRFLAKCNPVQFGIPTPGETELSQQ